MEENNTAEKFYLVIWNWEYEGEHETIAKHLFRNENDAVTKMREYKNEILGSGWFARHTEGTDYDLTDSYGLVAFEDYDGDHAEYITMEEIEVE